MYLGIFKLDQLFKTICMTMGESFIYGGMLHTLHILQFQKILKFAQ